MQAAFEFVPTLVASLIFNLQGLVSFTRILQSDFALITSIPYPKGAVH